MYHFIINPNSGSGRGLREWNRISRYLSRCNIEYDAFLTAGPGEARRAAAALTERGTDPGCIIVVGGDGTINEVVDGISFRTPPTIGYIPAGTGNDLARCLRLPSGTLACLKRQMTPSHMTAVDYGVLTYGKEEPLHRRFLVSSGIGFDASVCLKAAQSKAGGVFSRLGLGRISYLLAGISCFFRCRSSRGYVVLDGVKKVEFNYILFISCHIQPAEGGGFFFAPKADNRDGKLNICVFSHASRLKLLPLLLSAGCGRGPRQKGGRSYECREALIHVEQPLPVHVDGEGCGLQNEIRVSCMPRQVKMMI